MNLTKVVPGKIYFSRPEMTGPWTFDRQTCLQRYILAADPAIDGKYFFGEKI